MEMSQRQSEILLTILKNGALSSSAIYTKITEIGDKISLVTIKRALSDMAESGLLVVSGSGPSTIYEASAKGRLFFPIDAREYCTVEPDKRFGLNRYNFELFPDVPANIFNENELKALNTATAEYKKRTKNISAVIQKKELERLIIELAWKSSKIEGNTYTLRKQWKIFQGSSQKRIQLMPKHCSLLLELAIFNHLKMAINEQRV